MSGIALVNTVPPVQLYNGTQATPNLKVCCYTGTTVNGIVTVYATLDGTATGQPQFSTILHAACTPWQNTTTVTQMPYASGAKISTDLRTISFSILTPATVNVVASVSSQLAASGVQCTLNVWGLP